ncbi:MAG: ethylbenzene dehydrogenase-related protein, partial [bacterium]
MRGIGYIFGGVLLCAVLVWISGPSFAQDIVATVGTPVLDGAASPGEWPTGAATDSVLTTTGVTIKAMVDNVYVYILAQWADDSGTESVHKKRWTFDGTSWSQSGNEDRVAMVWDMGLNGTQGANCATMCHPNTPGKDNDMYTDTGEVDVWHWKAARTNPMGYVDDKYWKHYPGDESATRKGDGGNNTYDDNGPVGSGYPADMAVGDPGAQATFLYRSGMAFDPFGVIDAGLGHEAVVFDSLAAWSAGDVVPGYSLEDPDGSRGDVEAAGDYQNGVWTVEMRRLHAGTSHDFEVRPGGSVDFAVAEFDNAGGMNHTMDTNVYTLRFPQFLPPDYVGSSSCALCHSSTHSDWEQTLHHIMLQDTSGILTQEATGVSVFDPRAPGYDTYVEGVFPSTPPIDDVSYTIGSHWKQRYLKEMGGDEFAILPAQWVVKTQEWGAYHAADWDAEGRRWGKKCAGCHTTGYTPSGVNTPAGTFNEMGVGCETCHGPGSDHTDSMDPADIVNPEELAFDRANEVCGQCHYRGSSSAGYYGFAWNETDDSRFLPGEVLADHITESPGLWPDGMTSTKHHQQWLDWKNSEHSRHDVGCISCHDPHAETEYGHQLKLDNDDNSLCTSCHGDLADPAAATAHSGHSYDP